ncbi:hypothetical protein PVAP13_9KG412647 [Panicum virgatum]|uniref:Vacuolar protein sorting-associated protein 35 n=1 Tax=Panicum virgatum TaxID=38727 RepID=A0A8T0N875_PANVG|nr:hypothetical protein PVAP13_9KG412647 [Panicum virgatum]
MAAASAAVRMLPDGGADDEERWLAEGIAGVQQNAFYMHRALDSNNLKDALKYSAQMLSELRTSRLSPHKYYELYMRAFDEMRKLEMFFREETRRGSCSVVDLYELVQHAGNVLPRLYLLCTVGSVYIKSKEAPAKDVLKDLVEMCRGIQHPLRGLFLRSYLSQISRDKLPDIGSEYEGDAESINDAVEFVLQNFIEMNKLWVRMQHQGPVREKEKRGKERNELRDLVGKNLHVLSQIEGVDLDMYKETVLPRILEQVVNCKDDLAQFYLMDCIIQVFPDEYHLQTLETLLSAFPQLQPSVDIKTVLSQLMDRLSNYAASSPEVLSEFLQVEAFAKFSNAIGKVIEAQPDMPVVGAVTLYVSLLTFTLRVHPDRLDYVDQVLGACVKKLSGKAKLEDSRYSAKLLKKPDQCRAVYACSHLFWTDDQDGIMDGERVLLCLKRALRIANAAQQMANATRGSSRSVTLFIEILNKYLYFFEKGIPQITNTVIQDLIELIRSEKQSDNTVADPSTEAFFSSTLRYIEFQKQKGGSIGEKYEQIKTSS